MLSLLACLAVGFFILWLVYRLQHRWMLPRLIWPYFIADILRYRRAPGMTRGRWILLVNVAIVGIIIGMIATYEIAGAFHVKHVWHGVQISVYVVKITYVWCDHGWHNAALRIVRWVIFTTAVNLFTALAMSWEDCRRELLCAFAENKFLAGHRKLFYTPRTAIFSGRPRLSLLERCLIQWTLSSEAQGFIFWGLGTRRRLEL